MDTDRARSIKQLRSDNGWTAQIRSLGAVLRSGRPDPGNLLIVGTPAQEPWHLVAHLEEEARLAGLPQLSPTLVRHRVPLGAPPHLAVDLSRIEAAGQHETVFVVAQGTAPERLLSRVHDARHAGATILALQAGDSDLQALAHETLTVDGVPPNGSAARRGTMADFDAACGLQARFDTAQHLVCVAAGLRPSKPRHFGRRGTPVT